MSVNMNSPLWGYDNCNISHVRFPICV